MNAMAAALYRLSPVWAQNMALSGFGALLSRERYGGRYLEFREALALSEKYSRTELETYQDERLRAVVRHAYETVPYYRRTFDAIRLTPADIRSQADLPKLPLLTRENVRKHYDELRSSTISRKAIKSGHTSGTTGTPLTIGYDAETIWMTYAVFDRHYEWAGCRMGRDGDRIAVARGNVVVPLTQRRPPYWRINRPQNQLLLSSFHLSRATLPLYFEELARFRPAVLDGYPSTLYLLAKFLQSCGETFPLKAAVTSSETLYDFQRDTIEAAFECRVFDYFALAERTVFSGECSRHEGHHIAMEYGLAETVDPHGSPVPAGTTGRLLGTSLHNMAMPLIRYVTNDMTSFKTQSCSCGRALQLMDDVTTKAEDVLTLSDGRVISPSVLTHPFKPLDCIQGSQIVQTEPDAVTVRIVPGSNYTPAHSAHLITELSARLGQNVTITIEMVEALEHKGNGKFKWVISHVPIGI